jgi:hypothetical protein
MRCFSLRATVILGGACRQAQGNWLIRVKCTLPLIVRLHAGCELGKNTCCGHQLICCLQPIACLLIVL